MEKTPDYVEGQTRDPRNPAVLPEPQEQAKPAKQADAKGEEKAP